MSEFMCVDVYAYTFIYLFISISPTETMIAANQTLIYCHHKP